MYKSWFKKAGRNIVQPVGNRHECPAFPRCRLGQLAVIFPAFSLSLALLIGLAPTPVSSAISGEYTYTVIDEIAKTARLNRIARASGEVIIPRIIDGYKIISLKNTIDGNIFTSVTEGPPDTAVTGVIIPDSVTNIGSRAFAKCKCLTSVTLPDSVTSIDFYAFCKTGITSINIPASVASMGNWVFNGCSGLASAYFYGNSPANFGESVFAPVASDFKIYYIQGKSGWTSPTWSTFYPAEPFASIGDVNSDGSINIQDVVLAVNFVLSRTAPTAVESGTADYNGDGSLNIQDVVLIVNKAMGR
jgi:hypothetical protein